MTCKRTFLIAWMALWPLRAYGDTALEQRMAREVEWQKHGLFILPHRPTYVMPMSYNPHPNNDPFPTKPLNEVETKFQVSIKVPITKTLFKLPVQTYLAYTQVSYWQTYNQKDSSFFRESNFEPEFFLQLPTALKIGSVTNRFNRLGFAHQSNGQADPLSRSWNRIFAEFVFDQDPAMVSIKPWFRIPGPPEKDSNPAMAKYYGYGELRGAMKFWKQNEASLLFRNNLRIPDNKGAIELGWAFPLLRSMKGFIQYFNGYGESLIDYNVPSSRISVGVSFSDWL